MFGEMVRVEFEPTIDEGTRHFIVNGVDNYNVAVTSLPDYFPVNFVLRDQRGGVLGGVLGQLWGGWLHVTYLWVTKKARGLGHGTRLMQNAEAYAHSRGAVGATLETHSFQARPFYERLGYEVFSTLDGYPLGHAKYFLKNNSCLKAALLSALGQKRTFAVLQPMSALPPMATLIAFFGVSALGQFADTVIVRTVCGRL